MDAIWYLGLLLVALIFVSWLCFSEPEEGRLIKKPFKFLGILLLEVISGLVVLMFIIICGFVSFLRISGDKSRWLFAAMDWTGDVYEDIKLRLTD